MRQHTLMRGTFTQDIDMSWIFVIGKSGPQQVSAKMASWCGHELRCRSTTLYEGGFVAGRRSVTGPAGRGREQDGEEEKTVGERRRGGVEQRRGGGDGRGETR